MSIFCGNILDIAILNIYSVKVIYNWGALLCFLSVNLRSANLTEAVQRMRYFMSSLLYMMRDSMGDGVGNQYVLERHVQWTFNQILIW